MRLPVQMFLAFLLCTGCANNGTVVPASTKSEAPVVKVRQPEHKTAPNIPSEQLSSGRAENWVMLPLSEFERFNVRVAKRAGTAEERSTWFEVMLDWAIHTRQIGKPLFGPDPDAPLRIRFVAEDATAGMAELSYNPELDGMGLKVGRDGNLHRVGPDARSASDPDEGPAVGWDELHRKQFGH
jgi:hypothetical protein